MADAVYQPTGGLLFLSRRFTAFGILVNHNIKSDRTDYALMHDKSTLSRHPDSRIC